MYYIKLRRMRANGIPHANSKWLGAETTTSLIYMLAYLQTRISTGALKLIVRGLERMNCEPDLRL